ncbi:hypothetical protein DPMN_165818 [Dreissena polymorpha]|uniref:B box-type domain-containing protein n=1 Tax=Dreissena polymorpha TaxID=45954 RepID=A0A9D4F0E3_DREPO|nr:hypothetical protein DPMN_165818 [Dreissena polymorpha]
MDLQSIFKEQSSSGPIIVKKDSTTDENYRVELFCEPCNYVDNTNKKECNGFCVECTEYLCSDCIQDHKKNKITRQHVVLQKDDLPVDISPFLQLKEMSQCISHRGRKVEFECADHNKLLCSLCLSKDHRDCKIINDLTANEHSIKLDIGSVLDTVETYLQNTKAIVYQKELHLKDLENQGQEIYLVCDDYVQSVKGQIDRINSEVKSKAATVMFSEKISIEHTITEYSQFKSEIERLNELLNILQHGDNVEKAAVVKYLATQIEHLNTCIFKVQKSQLSPRNNSSETALACLQSLCKIASYSSDDMLLFNSSNTQPNQACMFSTNDTTEEKACTSVTPNQPARLHMTSGTTVKTEGPLITTSSESINTSTVKTRCELNLSVTSTQSFLPPSTESASTTSQVTSRASGTTLGASITNAISGSLTTLTISDASSRVTSVPVPSLVHSNVSVRTLNEKYSPSIVACANLQGSRIAILDNINNKVKLLSDENDIRFYVDFKLSSRPSDMCAFVAENQQSFLYVCFPQLKQIQKIAVMAKRQNSVVGIIETKFHPISITNIGAHVILLSKSCIDGLQLTTFAFEQLHVDSGNIKCISEDGLAKLATRIRSLNNTSVLFIRCSIVTCVQVGIRAGGSDLYVVGELWRTVAPDDVLNIADIAIHKNDIYVCGFDSKNLKLLKSGGLWKSALIVKCEYKPQSLLFDGRRSRIIVGTYNDNNLHVYRTS